MLAVSARAATLSLSPSEGALTTGETTRVDILLNTEGVSIDGVDIRFLKYDPAALEIQDANPSRAGIQISEGALMPVAPVNKANTAAGQVEFSQITSGGSTFSNTSPQMLASVLIRPLTPGPATLVFDFTPGRGDDANIASKGVDVLSAVTHGSYTVTGAPVNATYPAGGQPGGEPIVYVLTKPLALGSRSNDVVVLQQILIAEGHLSAGNATGYFGPLTLAAVKSFQQKYGIASQGVPGHGRVGPKTRIKLGALSKVSVFPLQPFGPTISGKAATLMRGSKNAVVARLQQLLITEGFLAAGNATGLFGPRTEQAVKIYQCQKGIACAGQPGYGTVGPKTRASLGL